MPDAEEYDALILGAGAAGMFCAARAAARGGRALVVDHASAPGEKIRISGGGRCNFTNLRAGPENFISANRHFAKSALKRFSAADFVALVRSHGVPFHEKTLGQLFCDHSARDVIDLLLAEMGKAGAELRLDTKIITVARTQSGFSAELENGSRRYLARARRLVVATGGKSIPKMGATGLAYRLAEQFDIPVVETRPALVPLTFGGAQKEALAALAGLSADGEIRSLPAEKSRRQSFREALLFTHRGLSGPAVLQISSYWREGESVAVSLGDETALLESLKAARSAGPKRGAPAALAESLPKRLAQHLCAEAGAAGDLGQLSDKALARLAALAADWRLTPTGSEGYRTAEVTLGGVDTAALSSQSMEVRSVPGLHFIGEAVDVTGWLGGYNFQWAWSSAHAAGTAIAEAGR